MHKKLAAELTSLAHSILQMKNKENVFLLQKKAHEVYEKLSVLAYVEEYINTTPQATETKEELLAKIEEVEKRKETTLLEKDNFIGDLDEEEEQMEDFADKIAEEVIGKVDQSDIAKEAIDMILETNSVEELEVSVTKEEEPIVEIEEEQQLDDISDSVAEDVIEAVQNESVTQKVVEEIVEQPFDALEKLIFGGEEDQKFDETRFIEEQKTPTLEDELKDTLSIDETVDLFTKIEEPKKSLNDRLQNTIQIGLNDRIAFVKHLFDGDSGDFNRVVSQLNTFDDEKEAKRFINKTVKPDYDWSGKEEYEVRFIKIIERKFA